MTGNTRSTRGGTLVLVASILLVLGIFALGGFHLARLAIAKQDTQRAADSYALSAAEMYRGVGSRYNQGDAQRVAEANIRPTRADRVSFSPESVFQGPNKCVPPAFCGAVNVPVKTQMNIALPRLVWSNPQETVKAASLAQVDEIRHRGVEQPDLDIVLVLDYSCSMGGTPMANQKAAVKQVLGKFKDQVAFSVYLFSSGIDGQVSFNQEDNARNMYNQLVSMVDGHDANGGTNTADALRSAMGELTARMNMPGKANRQRYVILASDGEPNDGPSAMAAAEALKKDDALNATLVSVAIGRGGEQFMRQVAGTHKDPHPSNLDGLYFVVDPNSNPQPILDAFEEIILRLMCNIPDPFRFVALQDATQPGGNDYGTTISGFLKMNGSEKQIIRVDGTGGALGADSRGLFRIEGLDKPPPATNANKNAIITFNRDACFARRDGAEFIMRFNHPRLVARAP